MVGNFCGEYSGACYLKQTLFKAFLLEVGHSILFNIQIQYSLQNLGLLRGEIKFTSSNNVLTVSYYKYLKIFTELKEVYLYHVSVLCQASYIESST